MKMSKKFSQDTRPISAKKCLFENDNDDDEDVDEDEVDEVSEVEVDEDQEEEEEVSFLDNAASEIITENQDALQNICGDTENFTSWKNDRDIQEYLRNVN